MAIHQAAAVGGIGANRETMEEFGFVAKTSLEESLRQTIACTNKTGK